MVTLYTQPACAACTATKRALDSHGVPYEEIDLTQDATALSYVKELGFTQVPIIVTPDDAWSGYKADKIAAILKP